MPHAEALLFAADRPLTLIEITSLLSAALEVPVLADRAAACIEAVAEKYSADYYPFSLKESGGGFQFLTKKEYHNTVLQLNGDKYIRRLSTAALETLAIIAYRQPATKSEVEYIRGVSVDYSIQKLLEKELIVIIGRREHAIGKPLEYATSRTFMDYLGINSAAELPQLKDITDVEIVVPTAATEALPEDTPLAVTADGTLVERNAPTSTDEPQEPSTDEQ